MSTTANYGWVKPDVGASDDAWGGQLNADLDGIDSVVHGIDVRGMTPGPPGPTGPTGPAGANGAAGPPGPAAVSTDVGNSARLGSDSLVYVPTPTIPPGTVVSATAPVSPQVGQLWWDSVGGQLYVWFADVDSSQWVIAVNSAASLLPASTTVLGGVKVDGTTIKAAVDGTISTTVVPLGDNRIINGDMRIDQRNNGASGTANGYTVDRWQYQGSQPGKFAWARQTSPAGPSQFPYYLIAASQSAYSLAVGDYFQIYQVIEADMISDFAWGTPNAQPVTLSFWAYSSLTGTFSASISNTTSTRSYPFTYSLPAASVWTKIIVTIPGDTSGTWAPPGNAGWGGVHFDLGTGATYRGPANAWASANYVGVTGSVSVVSTNAAVFLLTGVKLEIGSVATPFNRQSLAKSMADCQRYFANIVGSIHYGYNVAATATFVIQTLPTTMRATPTVAFSGQSYNNSTSIGLNGASQTSIMTILAPTATGGCYCAFQAACNAEL